MKVSTKRRLDALLSRWLIGLHMLLARGLGWLLRRNHRLTPAPRHILFIKILGLGSVFMAADAIATLKRKYPEAKFILLCGSGLKAGLAPTQLFDEIWVVKDKNLFTLFGSVAGMVLRCWRRGRMWVVDLEVYSKLTSIFALWTMAVNRFGFVLDVVQFRRNLNTHNVYFNRFIPIRKNYLSLAEAMGAAAPAHFSFPQAVGTRSPQACTHIAVNNTCSDLSPERKLPDAQLKIVLEELLQQQQLPIALVGAPSDRATYAAFLQQHFPNEGRIENKAGALSFSEYYHFLYTQCSAMITIDSAPLHIARALGLPVLSFWGPTNPMNYLGERPNGIDDYAYLQVKCSPCVHFTEDLPCGGNNFCMKDLSLALLSEKISAFLEKLPAAFISR